MEPIRLQLLSLHHLWTHQDWQIIFFDPVSGVRVDARGQRIPPGMVPQIVFDPTLGRPVQIGWVDPQFQRQLLLFLDVQGFLKVHLLVHHL